MTTNMEFKTILDLDSAGYERTGRPRVLAVHRGVPIHMRDTSGGRYRGYSYAVTVRYGIGSDDYRIIATSQDIWLADEVNRAGQRGASATRFGPGKIAEAIQAACDFIDGSTEVREYYAAYPDAR